MDYAKTISHLKEAEIELFAQIGSNGPDADFDAMHQALDIAESIKAIRMRLSDASGFKPLRGGTNSASDPKRDATSNDREICLPAYFIRDEKLVKIARRGEDTDELYKKNVPFGDVESICASISPLLSSDEFFSINDLQAAKPGVPAYKVQLTVASLVAIGVLESVGRGKYSRVATASKSDKAWLNLLRSEPDLHYLIEEQEKGKGAAKVRKRN
ncbi:MAG: hypothetical protein IJO87_05860 [Eggerthellaceae bacterium]|nr:hypothetical protein [Eggerthellaceae bacterium]